MQHKAVYLLFCKFTVHVSGVNHIHHQEYTKLYLQPPVLVIFFCAATTFQRAQARSNNIRNATPTITKTISNKKITTTKNDPTYSIL